MLGETGGDCAEKAVHLHEAMGGKVIGYVAIKWRTDTMRQH
jgi:hypothetical protein